MAFSQGYALVVGVGSFLHHQNLNVPITAADAQAVADILKNEDYCGYPAPQVSLLTGSGATKQHVLTALHNLAETVGADSTVFLFLCSHGVFGTDGQWYFTTHDVHLQGDRVTAGSALSEAELIDSLRGIKAQRLFVVFNACFSGAISPALDVQTDGFAIDSLGPTSNTANAILGTGKGRIIIAASGEEQKSYFVPGEPITIFTKALVDGLRGRGVANKSGFVSAFNLYESVYETVSERVEDLYQRTQHPELTILKGKGSFAVSLYRGASTLGEFKAETPDAEYGRVREVSERTARRAIDNLLGDGAQQISAGRDVNIGGNVIHGDYVAGDQTTVQGDQINIDTGGGSVYQRDINVEGGTFIGRDQNINTGGAPVEFKQFFGSGKEPVDPSFPEELPDVPANLRHNMLNYLSRAEIKGISFDLGFDYNRLPGESLDERVAELILTCQRQNKVRELMQACQETNSNVNWKE
ncbi:MAG: caspase family protein [Ardenticatenaceae bacterium]|nr:caspase family protein [Ardenticatenaceae bacterium]